MKAVITGDIINSQESDTAEWLEILKTSLSEIGKKNKEWEIFRGDSFQLLTEASIALHAAFQLKAHVKTIKDLDVRMAIGIGDVTYFSDKVTTSNGSAFVNSGVCFDELKKNTLAIKSHNVDFDETFNLIFQLVTKFTNDWTPASAAIVATALQQPGLNQYQLGEKLSKSQSTINAALKRSGYDEIKNVMAFYKDKIEKI